MISAVDPDLVLVDGVCNHCLRYGALFESRVVPVEQRPAKLAQLVRMISRAGKGKQYDCIIGVSGGVDSSYVALQVKQLGLRPLAVHVNNGWNDALAELNIERLLRVLDMDVHTEALRLDEFYDLQRSFLKASTPDADIPSDHAIQATLWRVARQHGVRFIISGMNFATESISVPSWSYGHSDWRYIHDVHRRFGQVPLRTYPHFGFATLAFTTLVRRVRIVSILNYLDFDKSKAMGELVEQLDWVPYEGKHYESIFTRWVQGFYPVRKFGIDKRRGHYSDLINSGQITRAEALAAVSGSDYSERLRHEDEILLREKLSLTAEQLDEIVDAPASSFRAYRNSYAFVQFLRGLVNRLRRLGLYPR